MRAMATRAVGDHLRASPRRQPVVAGQICRLAAALHSKLLGQTHAFMAARARRQTHVLRRDWRIGIGVCLDGVNSMAIGAHRRLPVALGDGLSVDALVEFLGDGIVTLAAGRRHIELENRRLRVPGVENLVRAVAVGADRGLLRAGGNGMSVDTLLVRCHHLGALSAVLHYKFLAVARAAGRGNVGMMHARLRIAGRQQLMRAAVAIDAGGRLAVASLDGLAVEAAIVRSLLVRVAGGACDFQRRSFVRGTLDVGVAVHAGKHAAVDGIFESLRIDVQADGFAIDLVSQRGVAMTSETFFRSGFRKLLAGGLFAGGVDRCCR